MRFLKYIIFFLLIINFLFQKEIIIEFLKLPALIEHFLRHQSGHRDEGIVNFIALHYNNEGHHKEDHHEHDRLPFSGNHSAGYFQTIQLFDHMQYEALNFIFLPVQPAGILPCSNFFYSEYFQSIWQPPKIS